MLPAAEAPVPAVFASDTPAFDQGPQRSAKMPRIGPESAGTRPSSAAHVVPGRGASWLALVRARYPNPRMAEPAYRSSVCRAVLSAVDELLEPAVRQRILERAPADAIARIRDTGRLGWVPAETLHAVNLVIADELGMEGYRDFFRRQTLQQVEMPIFAAMFRGALRVFGVEPSGLLRLLGRSWDAVTQALGHIECMFEGPHAARIRLFGVPAGVRIEPMAFSMEGSILALLELAGRSGVVTTDSTQLMSDGILEMLVTW